MQNRIKEVKQNFENALYEFSRDILSMYRSGNDGRGNDYGFTLYFPKGSNHIRIENINRDCLTRIECTALQSLDYVTVEELENYLGE